MRSTSSTGDRLAAADFLQQAGDREAGQVVVGVNLRPVPAGRGAGPGPGRLGLGGVTAIPGGYRRVTGPAGTSAGQGFRLELGGRLQGRVGGIVGDTRRNVLGEQPAELPDARRHPFQPGRGVAHQLLGEVAALEHPFSQLVDQFVK